MFSARFVCLLVAMLPLLWPGVNPLIAQQTRERKVFTNEDVARPAPSAPAKEAPASAEAPAAEQPGAAAENAPRPESAQSAVVAVKDLDSLRGLKLAQYVQDILRRDLSEFASKLDDETDPARQERWRNMMNAINLLMQQNLQYISELEEQSRQQQPEQAAAQSTP